MGLNKEIESGSGLREDWNYKSINEMGNEEIFPINANNSGFFYVHL